MSALDALRNGAIDEALPELYEQVRAEPDQARHRIFLFQLLSVVGDWDRALTQLNVAQDLDPTAGVMAKAYQEILHCEALRQQVFDGTRTPLIFGDPEPWLAQLIQAIQVGAQGHTAEAHELRMRAMEEAPANPGELSAVTAGETDSSDEQTTKFEWLADGDARLGPVLEMIVNGRYYWAPLHHIKEITIEPPSDLRDLVWTPAQFVWANQGEAVGVIPTRYIGSESAEDDAVRLARKTNWSEPVPGAFEGLGQRVFITDSGDFALMDMRRITFPSGS